MCLNEVSKRVLNANCSYEGASAVAGALHLLEPLLEVLGGFESTP